jgi:circadian clock protein KaiB
MKKNKIASKKTDKLVLQLFVSGMTEKSMKAIENIKHICDQQYKGTYELEIIDIYKDPHKASEHHIVFSPSLIKKNPLPKKILIGTLSDREKVMTALGIATE